MTMESSALSETVRKRENMGLRRTIGPRLEEVTCGAVKITL